MKRTLCRWILAASVLVVALGAGRARAADKVWSHPDLERLRPARVAILPAVSFVYLPKERAYVEDAWMQRFTATRRNWIPAILSRERMAGTSKGGDSLLNKIGEQVRSRGRVDSLSSASMARLLQCQAMLCLRIDRWERVGRAGTNARVFVDMTASLVDSSGRLLWKATSEERVESLFGLPKEASARSVPPEAVEEYEAYRARHEGLERSASSGRPGEMGMAGQVTSIGLDYQTALDHIFARWEKAFPAAPARGSTATRR